MAEKNKAVLLHSKDGDWEGLFINGELISEGHQLGEGRRETFWLDIGANYRITGGDLVVMELDGKDDEGICDVGMFPRYLSELHGKY